MNIIAITQARTGSTRLPNKILKKIKDNTLLDVHIKRIAKAKSINSIIIATTDKKEDNIIEEEATKLKVNCYRGSENDVLDRFYQAAKKYNPDYVVRLTSDCPLIDAKLIDLIIEKAIANKADYCSNTLVESFPDGQDIEVFTFESLQKAWEEAMLPSEREHVTPFIKKNSTFNNADLFEAINVHSERLDYQNVRMTVDEPNDYEVIYKLVDKLGFNEKWEEYARLYLEDASIHSINMDIVRNEGYLKSIKKEINN